MYFVKYLKSLFFYSTGVEWSSGDLGSNRALANIDPGSLGDLLFPGKLLSNKTI